jgi:hypothetical protein
VPLPLPSFANPTPAVSTASPSTRFANRFASAMGCCGSSPVIGTLEVPQGIEQLLGQKKEVASDVAIFET